MSHHTYHQSKHYDGHSSKELTWNKQEFDRCTFEHIDFSTCDFSGSIFNECIFNTCNLSLTKLIKTAFREVVFNNCKLMGLRFDQCNPLGLSFQFNHCLVSNCTYFGLKLKAMVFNHSRITEADFTECDLTDAKFLHCDLLGSRFDRSNLSGADFRSSIHFIIDPVLNKMKNARFSSSGLSGLLAGFGIIIED